MGDKTLEVARDFKFYMTCKMNNPVFSPEVKKKKNQQKNKFKLINIKYT
jgi:hypothetical protein